MLQDFYRLPDRERPEIGSSAFRGWGASLRQYPPARAQEKQSSRYV